MQLHKIRNSRNTEKEKNNCFPNKGSHGCVVIVVGYTIWCEKRDSAEKKECFSAEFMR